MEFLVDGYKDKYFNYDEGVGVEKNIHSADYGVSSRYLYEDPTVGALSHLYWAVGLYRPSDIDAIDEFMRINECDIYREFSGDEMEWSAIRSAAKDYIQDNKSDFPTRFSFVLNLKLLDYDRKRKAFQVRDDYSIKSLRRFELFSSNFRTPPCVKDHPISKGLPRAIVMEFSRPFSLTHVPMAEEVANKYIKTRGKLFKERYAQVHQTKRLLYNLRDAYLVMNVKIFAHGEFLGNNIYEIPMVQLMGVMESYAVYEDENLTKLFYEESYISNSAKSVSLDEKLKEQYKILEEMAIGDGLLK